MDKYFDIAIIGAGAAGLAAAISSLREIRKKKSNCTVALIEKSKHLGKKILVTGNGKCNISNCDLSSKFYYGNNKSIVESILNNFGVEELKQFFSSLGLVLKEDKEGRLYPSSKQASSVVELMISEIRRLGGYEFCDFDIESISMLSDRRYKINSFNESIVCKKIIISTGGKSSPFSGYNGDGYGYLMNLGHKVTSTFPALVPVLCSSSILKQLKGVRWGCRVSLVADNNVIKSDLGEVQFNENNLSGICVLQVSRLASEFFTTSKISGQSYKSLSIILDLFPEYSVQELKKNISYRASRFGYISIADFMCGMLNKKLGSVVLKESKIFDASRCVSTLKEFEIAKLIKLLKGLKFDLSGVMEWKNSQVTAGGVKLDEFNERSLESKIRKGLYCAGEILDVDGLCGGYNLHWAWATGYIAGYNAAVSAEREKTHR